MLDVVNEVAAHCLSPECLAHPETAPGVSGFTSRRVKCLLNRLVKTLPADESYLEIGCFNGATLIGALSGSSPGAAYAFDNWSEYGSRAEFTRNIERYRAELPPLTVSETDCFASAPMSLSVPVGVYFYDGGHTAEEQERAITHFWPALAKRAVIVVDDWNWAQVRFGTWQGLEIVKPKVVHFREMPARSNQDALWFHNGLGIFYVEKNGVDTLKDK